MLYHVTFHMDRQALVAAGEKALKARSAEVERAMTLQREGKLIGFWERVDANGVIFVLDVAAHDELNTELRSLPLFPFVKSIDVIPLLPYPEFPEFAEARKKGV